MFVRILTGVILTPFVIILFVYAPSWANWLFFQLVTVIGAAEFFNIISKKNYNITHIITFLLILPCPAIFFFKPWYIDIYIAISFMIITVVKMIYFKPLEDSINDAGKLVFGFIYVGILYSFPVLLIRKPYHDWLIVLAGIVWLGDTGAYFTGKYFGKHKLYEPISPKKTVEGGIGGIVGSVFGALLAKFLFTHGLPFFAVVLAAIFGAVAEQAGDFVESLLKRAHGVKDSGAILPGHGGILDRFDGFMFAAPIVYLIAMLVQ